MALIISFFMSDVNSELLSCFIVILTSFILFLMMQIYPEFI